MRRVGQTILLVLALLVLIGGVIAWTEPAVAAIVCPQCFGFERLRGSIFVDPAMSTDLRSDFLENVTEGEQRVSSFFGGLRERPTILACASTTCARRMHEKGARAVSYAQYGLRLSPVGLDVVTVAHERTHIEVHGRIGIVRFLTGALPAWFDEGLAVLVSDDPRYLRPAGSGDRCLAAPNQNLPIGTAEWMRRASADPTLYTQAACRVQRWADAHGGRDGLLLLIDRVGAGASFDTVWDNPPNS
jgi:hypothetical protein